MSVDRRLVLTGVAALGAVALTFGGRSLLAEADRPSAASYAALRDFHGVTVAGPDHVVITQAKDFAVRTEGDQTVLNRLNIYVKNDRLHIERRKFGTWFGEGDRPATIHVAMPALTRVALAGSGDVTAQRLSGAHVQALVAGSGNLSIKAVAADDADLAVNGSGDMTVAGKVRSASLKVVGSGDVRGENLRTGTANLNIMGSGDIFIHAGESASVSILGSGDAHVRGTTECRITKMGSGEAHCAT